MCGYGARGRGIDQPRPARQNGSVSMVCGIRVARVRYLFTYPFTRSEFVSAFAWRPHTDTRCAVTCGPEAERRVHTPEPACEKWHTVRDADTRTYLCVFVGSFSAPHRTIDPSAARWEGGAANASVSHRDYSKRSVHDDLLRVKHPKQPKAPK